MKLKSSVPQDLLASRVSVNGIGAVIKMLERQIVRWGTQILFIGACLAASLIAQKSSDVRLETDLPGSTASSLPRIAASGDRVYVAWWDQRNGNRDVYFNRSLDGGATWLLSDIRLNRKSAATAFTEPPDIVSLGNNSVYVTWSEDRRDNGRLDIYFNRSLDAGATWLASAIRLDTDLPGAGTSFFPQIAAWGNSVYVTWMDRRANLGGIYFNRSLDRGTTWLTNDLRLDRLDHGSLSARFPEIAVSGDLVYVTWEEPRFGGGSIFLNLSRDRGTTWLASDIRLETPRSGSASEDPKIAVAGDSVYVTWHETRHVPNQLGLADIFLNRSLDGGATWLINDIRLDTDLPGAAWSRFPEIAASGDAVYVTWNDERNGGHLLEDIYFNRSLDGGTTWMSSDIRLDTDAPGMTHSSTPQIVASGEFVYVAWTDWRNADHQQGPTDIYFNRSLDGGTTWLSNDIRLNTDTPGVSDSRFPQIALSGESVYVTWDDERNGLDDIYFNIPFGAQPYGEGTAGSGSLVPSLTGSDGLTLGSVFTLSVRNGLGGALGAIGIGGPDSKASIPFAGGMLLLNSIIRTRPLLLDGSMGAPGAGRASTEFIVPVDTAFLGANFNFQAALLDPSAAFGLALTNGVEAWIL